MRKRFSAAWIRSSQPRKQRKYRYNAPLHTKQKFIRAHLSKDLQKKYTVRSFGLRKGDRVKVVRGQHKGKSGKVERIDIKREKIYITGIDLTKKEGSKVFIPLHPSKLLLQEFNLDDKKRREKLKQLEIK
jgi:large subunit ribosomal protein L24